jgi:hypothetical protein
VDYFVLNYIAHRMSELGFKKYHFEPYVLVLGTPDKAKIIQGHNEYYYLISKTLSLGTRIVADNNAFEVKDYYTQMGMSNIQEFTGQLQLSVLQTVTQEVFEFIRVIPD